MIAASTKLKQATVGDLTRAIKMLNRLKDFTSYMLFPCLNQELSDLKIMVFTDASLGSINDGTGITGAYIVWLADGTGLCCPLAWHASKIKRVVRSTIAAEALSLQEGGRLLLQDDGRGNSWDTKQDNTYHSLHRQ